MKIYVGKFDRPADPGKLYRRRMPLPLSCRGPQMTRAVSVCWLLWPSRLLERSALNLIRAAGREHKDRDCGSATQSHVGGAGA
jgi:hypothetical protein